MRFTNIRLPRLRLRELIMRFNPIGGGGGGGSPLTPVIIALAATTFVALFTILFTLRRQPETFVPDVVGTELAEAVIELQERELLPHIRLDFDKQSDSKGTVLKQSPSAGSNVRIGKRVNLVISRGPAGVRIDNFVGKTVADVEAFVANFDSDLDTTLQIDAVSYVLDEAPPGIIIAQAPDPKSAIGPFTRIDLVVSLGPVAVDDTSESGQEIPGDSTADGSADAPPGGDQNSDQTTGETPVSGQPAQ